MDGKIQLTGKHIANPIQIYSPMFITTFWTKMSIPNLILLRKKSSHSSVALSRPKKSQWEDSIYISYHWITHLPTQLSKVLYLIPFSFKTSEAETLLFIWCYRLAPLFLLSQREIPIMLYFPTSHIKLHFLTVFLY